MAKAPHVRRLLLLTRLAALLSPHAKAAGAPPRTVAKRAIDEVVYATTREVMSAR